MSPADAVTRRQARDEKVERRRDKHGIDYSVWHGCQWYVYRPCPIGNHADHRGTCSRRGRVGLSEWTWLCKQHYRMSRGLTAEELLRLITYIAGRRPGEL